MSEYESLLSEEPFCRERGEGWSCTRRGGHDGPHAAHGGFNVRPFFVWDDSGELWRLPDGVDA